MSSPRGAGTGPVHLDRIGSLNVISRMIAPRRKGRQLLTGMAVTALVAGSLFAAGGVLAVNATGAFELDGNAVTSHAGTTAPDDADRVCYTVAKAANLSDADA